MFISYLFATSAIKIAESIWATRRTGRKVNLVTPSLPITRAPARNTLTVRDTFLELIHRNRCIVMAKTEIPTSITSVLHEKRVFKPRKEFSAQADIKSLVQYRKMYNESVKAPEKFWAKHAKNELVWRSEERRVGKEVKI